MKICSVRSVCININSHLSFFVLNKLQLWRFNVWSRKWQKLHTTGTVPKELASHFSKFQLECSSRFFIMFMKRCWFCESHFLSLGSFCQEIFHLKPADSFQVGLCYVHIFILKIQLLQNGFSEVQIHAWWYPATQKVAGHYVIPSEPFECPFVHPSVHPSALRFHTLT